MCVIENNKQNLILENLSLDLINVEYECTGKFNVKGTKGSMTVFYSTVKLQSAGIQCFHKLTSCIH